MEDLFKTIGDIINPESNTKGIDELLKVVADSNCSTIDKINILNAIEKYIKCSYDNSK